MAPIAWPVFSPPPARVRRRLVPCLHRASLVDAAAHDEADDGEDERDEEHDLRGARGAGSQAAEAEERSDESDPPSTGETTKL